MDSIITVSRNPSFGAASVECLVGRGGPWEVPSPVGEGVFLPLAGTIRPSIRPRLPDTATPVNVKSSFRRAKDDKPLSFSGCQPTGAEQPK